MSYGQHARLRIFTDDRYILRSGECAYRGKISPSALMWLHLCSIGDTSFLEDLLAAIRWLEAKQDPVRSL
jgi:3-deoxy-D-manno-octulosonic-acid transferase